MKIKTDKEEKILLLFEEFNDSYLCTDEGLKLTEVYKQKEQHNLYIDDNLLKLINYLADTEYTLQDDVQLSNLADNVINYLSKTIDRFTKPALKNQDLFALFSYWLVNKKQYPFQKSDRLSIDTEKKYLMNEYEINPECPFDLETIKAFQNTEFLYYNSSTKCKIEGFSEIYNLVINKVSQPFNSLCTEAINKLPNYIVSILKVQDRDLDIFSCSDKIENQYMVLSDKYNSSFNIRFNRNHFYFNFDCREILQEIEERDILSKNIYCYIKNCYCDPLNYTEGLYSFNLPIEEVFKKSFDDIVDFIIEGFNYFFPLVLISTSDNPLPKIEEHLKIWNPKYKLEKYVDRTSIEKDILESWIKNLQRKKQIILYGSSGTGKTFIAENIAQYLISGTDGFYEIIQFHPNYSYEDFIQGIRPQTNNGQLEYNLVSGRFLYFCDRAKKCNDNCILIIDEINRANLSEVFGELMYLLEYRDKEIYLARSNIKFKIPHNVYIIGTMNTSDRSIALVDFALRRRFSFIKIKPNYEIIRKFHQDPNRPVSSDINTINIDGLINLLSRINETIEDENYYLGISYFLIEDLADNMENIWCWEIETYLEEYFYNNIEEVEQFRWDKVKGEIINKNANNKNKE